MKLIFISLFPKKFGRFQNIQAFVGGFTLVEILLVVAVSSILFASGISLLNPTFQLNRGNDARRKADLLKIQSGLEQYFADAGDYPGSVGWCAQISSATYPQVKQALGSYLRKIPQDPKYAGTTKDYYYWHYQEGQYRLYAVLDNTSDSSIVSQALNVDGGIPGCTDANISYNYRSDSSAPLGPTSTPLPPTNTPTITPTITLTPTPTPKAVYVDSTSNSGAESSLASVSWSHTINGTNRLLLVGVVTEISKTVTASWTPASTGIAESLAHVTSSPQGATGDRYAYLLYLKNPTSGTGTILVTLNSADNLKAGAISLYGVDQTTPLGTTVVFNGSGTTVTTTSITSQTTGMVVDVIAAGNNTGTSAPGTGQSAIWNTVGGSTNPSGAGSYKVGAASTTMSWSWGTSKTASIIAVPVRPAP